MVNHQLPSWVRVSFDHRFRMEGYTALRYREANDDRWFLNRLRVNLLLQPTSWWRVQLQGQDSRIFFKENASGQTPFTNRTDLRLAYTEFGRGNNSPLTLRVGRQELAYGDERIIGAANWGNVARTFDAAKLILRAGRWQWDFVSASVVVPQLRGISHHRQGNNLHMAYGRWSTPQSPTAVEPFFLWRVGGGVGDSLGGIQNQSRRALGVRVVGKLPYHLEYVTEWLSQSGRVIHAPGRETIRAWAQHSILRYTWPNHSWRPRLAAEYNFASGDARPGDGRSGTFDQMFPTPHEKYGLADQVGWQNIEHISGSLEVSPRKQLTVRFQTHAWHLAEARDGVYLAGGALAFRDPTGRSGRHVGQEVDWNAQYNWGPRYVGGGVGRLFPGHFLKAQSPGVSLTYVYLNVGYHF